VSGDAARAGAAGGGHRFCLVAARFNQRWVERLVAGARDVLVGQGVAEADLDTVWVPGSLELPLACHWAAQSGRFDAVIALGVVLRGETEHFRLVADVSAHGLARVALDSGVPVLNAVLAAHDPRQVEDRTGGRMGNKGAEAALAALEMARLRSVRVAR
jgi:6,7-dimethyl-8-ribityllumazine synthase